MKHRLSIIPVVVLITAACDQPEKKSPLPPTDLAARNSALEEVREAMRALETASPDQAMSMLQADDHRIRRAAVKRLANLKPVPDRAVLSLVRAMDDPRDEVRIQAAIALTHLRSPKSIDALIRSLVDKNTTVRQWAYKALKKLGPQAVPAMVRQLGRISPGSGSAEGEGPSDRERALQDILIESLSGMGKHAVPYLIEAIENDRSGSTGEAVELLGKIGKEAREGVHVLLDILNESADTELKKRTIVAIGRIGDVDPEVVPTLWAISESGPPALSSAAQKVLKKLEDDS